MTRQHTQQRPRSALLAALGLAGALAACGAPAGTAGAGGQTAAAPTSGAAATAGQASAAPGPGGATGDVVSVVISGGADAGTYTGSEEPNCSYGLIGPEGWGVQYSIADASAGTLSSLQLIAAAAGNEDDEDAMFQGTAFKMTVTIADGTIAGATYDVTVVSDASGSESEGTGSASVDDAGSTATIRATGTTIDGVKIDATVNCPSVLRM